MPCLEYGVAQQRLRSPQERNAVSFPRMHPIRAVGSQVGADADSGYADF